MERDREALIQEAQRAQRIVVAAMMQQVSLPTFLDLDISMAQLKGMFVLASGGTSTVGQLAEGLRIGRSAASLLVDRMVQDGLVERTEDSEDRRRTMIRLSRRGEDLISRLRQGREERNPLPAWLAKLSDQDLRALVQGLRALAAEAHVATGESLPLHSWPDQHG
jgi:MarR family transcriptional regulator, organic hydroperoxide resistance regulator